MQIHVCRVFVDAMHQSTNMTSADIMEGAHLCGIWRICNHSLVLMARSGILLERRVSWGYHENSKAMTFNLGAGRFWIGAGTTMLSNYASGDFRFARTEPPRVYTTGRQFKDELRLRAEDVKP